MLLRNIFYFIVKNLFYIFHTIYNRLEVRGRGNIPDAPVIVASNHASNIDPPLIGGVCKRRLRYLAKASLFRNPVLGFCIRSLGAIPVTREDSQRAGVVMKLMLDRLRDGESVLVFPEGSRSRDGKLQPLEGGAAFLSVKSGVPILPVYIAGSFAVCPPGSTLPRPAKLTVTFAPVISPEGEGTDRERRDAVTRALGESLSALEREVSGDD
jgi:1-acyl-sn-glycerol-3-phosphate acyltransferase